MSFRLKTAAGILIVQALLLLSMNAFILNLISNTQNSSFENRAEFTLKLYAQSALDDIVAGDLANLRSLTRLIAEDNEIAYARIFNNRGLILSEEGLITTPAESLIRMERKIELFGTEYGTAEIGFSKEELNASLNKVKEEAYALIAAELLVTALLSFFLGHILTRQVLHLGTGAERIASGEYGYQIPVKGNDELGRTADAFNRMSSTVKESHEELSRTLEEVQHTKEKLEKSEMRFKNILEKAEDGIITINGKGEIVTFNPAAEKLFGYKAGTVKRRNISILMPPSVAKNHQYFIDRSTQAGQSKTTGLLRDIMGKRSDGSEFPIEISLSRARYGDEWLFTGIIRDITERKIQDELTKKAREEAEDANKAKSNFLAMMSHEIRTPLNIITGMVEVLKEDEKNPEKLERLRTISGAGDSLLALIGDILDLSKIESGRYEVENRNYSPTKVVKEVCSLLSHKSAQKGIKLSWKVSADFPEVISGDENALRQVLVNLVGNAVKFTERGRIDVEGVLIEEDEEYILRFDVFDTGIGIDNSKLKKIFETFTQSDASINRKYGGTGLGLSISRNLVELMGGELNAASTPGKGSVFTFTLRGGRPSEEEVQESAEKTIDEIMNETPEILLAEDDPDNRNIFMHYLKDTPVKLTTVENGLQAFRRYKDKSFDLIFMDIRMPVMDGMQALEAIRRYEEEKGLEKVPIIGFSADALRQDLENAEKMGFNGYLAKPLKKKDLKEFMIQWFASAHTWFPDEEPVNRLEVKVDAEIADMIPGYLERRKEDCSKIHTLASEGEFEELKRLGHTLKGTGASYGFLEISRIGKELETAADNRDNSGASALAEELQNYLDNVVYSV
ncbi:hybrid sensor histidine kinase/response regulator [Limisalsivibrio acetivorans]|uniref:hybrid sensor histidine kinase/response regulator n=1 Tax=Limisalsivibrio acetivorans TaxID=1304888 RepID=UPI0003B5ADDB|nr:ATP-binding protein [Limisalsivibrio acetivorans]